MTSTSKDLGGPTALAVRALDLPAFFHDAGEALARSAPHDGRCWMTLDPATGLPTCHVAHNSVPPHQVQLLARNEFEHDDVNKFEALVRVDPPVATLRGATGGELERSPRYRDLLKPLGFGDELRATLVDEGSAWGPLALYRRDGAAPFDEHDVKAVATATRELTPTLRRAVLAGCIATDEASDGPGLLLLDADDGLETLSETARRWLDELGTTAEVPNVVYAVTARARLLGSGGPGGLARARVQTPAGRWLVFHGSVLDDGRTAVIVEPAHPPELAPLITQAYGLTDRERDITQLIVQGLSTTEIAKTLFLSPYTVQDHLKAIFSKVGVRSRRELVARIFFQHYAPRMGDGGIWARTAGSGPRRRGSSAVADAVKPHRRLPALRSRRDRRGVQVAGGRRRPGRPSAPSLAGGDPTARTPADNQTVRNVFVIGPGKKIKMILAYPMTTGRNFDEVLRVIDSLLLTANHKVSMPVNWRQGEDVIIAGSVSNEEAKEIFGGWDEPKPYIRVVPQPH